jgi:hypothetical protein
MKKEEFEAIRKSVVSIIGESPATMQEVILHLRDYPKDRTKEVLRFMQAEEKIGLNEKGMMFLK